MIVSVGRTFNTVSVFFDVLKRLKVFNNKIPKPAYNNKRYEATVRVHKLTFPQKD